MSGEINKIEAIAIKQSLLQNTRQYLVGHLKRPQKLQHIDDNKIEIGITSYAQHSVEDPHTHSNAYEYQYVLSGYTEYLNIDTNQVTSFKHGDFYRITPGYRYSQKSKPGTDILFIKVPPGNDKINIQPDKFVQNWLDNKIKTIRKDYTDDSKAPMPNSIRPAVAVALFKDEEYVLFLKRKDSGNWTLPGGTLDFGENLMSCGVREVKEETGFDIKILRLIGTYTNPKTVVEYSDGEVRQEFTLVYEGKITSGKISLDNESTNFKWLKLNEVLKKPLADSQRIRIQDIIEYKKNGISIFR